MRDIDHDALLTGCLSLCRRVLSLKVEGDLYLSREKCVCLRTIARFTTKVAKTVRSTRILVHQNNISVKIDNQTCILLPFTSSSSLPSSPSALSSSPIHFTDLTHNFVGHHHYYHSSSG